MTDSFRQLITPNYSARTSFADLTAYSIGGFLLSLPFLPFPALRFYFAVFTFFLYLTIIFALAAIDFVKATRSAWQAIWQIQLLKIEILVNGVRRPSYYSLDSW